MIPARVPSTHRLDAGASYGAGLSLATEPPYIITNLPHDATWSFLEKLIWDNPTQEYVKMMGSISPDWGACLRFYTTLVDEILGLVTALVDDPTVATVDRLKRTPMPGLGDVGPSLESHTWRDGTGQQYLVVMGVLITTITPPRYPASFSENTFRPPKDAGIRIIPANAFAALGGGIRVDLSDCEILTHIGSNAFGGSHVLLLVLPNNRQTLVSIGSRAFRTLNTSVLDLRGCTALREIGAGAFNSAIPMMAQLDLEGCAALETIGEDAFSSARLKHLDLSHCTALVSIGKNAFSQAMLTRLDLSHNTALVSIGDGAFRSSLLRNLTMTHTKALKTIGKSAFRSARLEDLNLNNCTALVSIGEDAFATSPLTTLRLNAKLQGIQSRAFQNATLTHLILSHCAELVVIGDSAFQQSRLSKIYMPSALVCVGASAFHDSRIRDLDLSHCSALVVCLESAFHTSPLVKLQLPVSIRLIGDDAFFHAQLTRLILYGCANLSSIGKRAFFRSPLTQLDLREASARVELGDQAFAASPLVELHGDVLLPEHYRDGKRQLDGDGVAFASCLLELMRTN